MSEANIQQDRLFSTVNPEEVATHAVIHATNSFQELPAFEVEQSISTRFEQQVAANSDRLAVRTRGMI